MLSGRNCRLGTINSMSGKLEVSYLHGVAPGSHSWYTHKYQTLLLVSSSSLSLSGALGSACICSLYQVSCEASEVSHDAEPMIQFICSKHIQSILTSILPQDALTCGWSFETAVSPASRMTTRTQASSCAVRMLLRLIEDKEGQEDRATGQRKTRLMKGRTLLS